MTYKGDNMQQGLFDDTQIHEKRHEKYERLKEVENERVAEMEAFTPDPIEIINFTGQIPEPLRIAFYFAYQEEIDLINKYFTVNNYMEANINRPDLLIRFLLALDQGLIKEDDLPCLTKQGSLL